MSGGSATSRKRFGERAALLLVVVAGLAIVLSVSAILAGAVYQPTAGVLAVVLSDRLALLWITLASSAHLVLVPAVCVLVALRDRRLQAEGVEVPAPRSVWSGHESVFGPGGGRQS